MARGKKKGGGGGGGGGGKGGGVASQKGMDKGGGDGGGGGAGNRGKSKGGGRGGPAHQGAGDLVHGGQVLPADEALGGAGRQGRGMLVPGVQVPPAAQVRGGGGGRGGGVAGRQGKGMLLPGVQDPPAAQGRGRGGGRGGGVAGRQGKGMLLPGVQDPPAAQGGGGTGRQSKEMLIPGLVQGGGGAGPSRAGECSSQGKKKRMSKEDYAKDDIDDFKMSVPTKTPAELRQEAYSKVATEVLKSGFNLPPQINLADLKVFSIPASLSEEDLLAFYQERREYSRDRYPFQISVRLDDGSVEFVPVTPEKEISLQERRYFIVQIVGEKARGRILVEEHSLYSVAVQTVYDGEDENKIPWGYFAGHEGLGPVIKEKGQIKHYWCSYRRVEDAVIYEGLGEELIAFYATFRGENGLKQKNTEQGEVYFDTTFVLCSEAERFAMAEDYVIRIMGRMPAGLARLLRVWAKLSKCIFWLHIYLIEFMIAENEKDRNMAKIAAVSAEKAKLKWATAQQKIQGCGLQFFPKVDLIKDGVVFLADGLKVEDVVLDEPLKRKLCGGEGLNLLRQDPEMAQMIMARLLGFKGTFPKIP